MARGRHNNGRKQGVATARGAVRRMRRYAAWVMVLVMAVAVAAPGAAADDLTSVLPAPQPIALDRASIAEEEVLVSRPQPNGTESAYEPLGKSEDGRYDVDELNQQGWKYRVNTEFKLAAGTLTSDRRTVIYQVPEGLEVRDVVPDHDYELTDASGHAMGRYTFDGKAFAFVFNDETVKANETKQVEGWLSYRFVIDDELKKHGAEVTLPGGGVIAVDRVYDLDVGKTYGEAEINDALTTKTYPYTITIDSRYGTPGNVRVADALTNGEVVGAIVVHDGAGNPVTLLGSDGNPLDRPALADAWLPRMEPGSRYVITYDVRSTVPAGAWDTVSNTVQVSSSNGKTCGQDDAVCVTDTATTSLTGGERPWQYKESAGRTDDGGLAWVVHLNANHANLNGWTWTDEPDEHQSTPQDVQLCRLAAASTPTCEDLTELPHTFDADDYAAYEIRYRTTIKDWAKQYANTSKLCLKDTQTCETAQGFHADQNPIGKRGEIAAQTDVDGTRAVTGRWTLYLDGGDSGYPADGADEWSVTDTLAPPSADGATHVFTDAQQQALREWVRIAFGEAADHVEVEFAADGTSFTLRVQGWRIPAGTRIEFPYESTLTTSREHAGLELRNCMADLLGYESCANLWTPAWTPTPGGETPQSGRLSVGKRDAAKVNAWSADDDAQRDDGRYADTTHDYDALRVSHVVDDGNDVEVPYLEWAIDVVADQEAVGDLTVVEHLPAGAELLTGTAETETNGRGENLAGLVVELPY